ncbi:hypothetical protein [Brazilian marseillevirus]|uniref:hypothetical protein n=1 Tax=Brazilian marseillevirus TaxID=1813599 RepID=UPI0007839F29|nr:hypothetical protein A3303_gp286 [Brazilian marseillevirus]AMQ10794.1 hypothetical protein [Brazilian marseillevirus]
MMEKLKFLEERANFLIACEVTPVLLKKTRRFVTYGFPDVSKTFVKRKNKIFSCGHLLGNKHGEELVLLNGKLSRKTQWVNGAKDGLEIIYYPNGRKLSEGYWQRGERTGIWNFWYADGNKSNEIIRYYGEVTRKSFWNREGKLMYSCDYYWGRKHGSEKKWNAYMGVYIIVKYNNGDIISSDVSRT